MAVGIEVALVRKPEGFGIWSGTNQNRTPSVKPRPQLGGVLLGVAPVIPLNVRYNIDDPVVKMIITTGIVGLFNKRFSDNT